MKSGMKCKREVLPSFVRKIAHVNAFLVAFHKGPNLIVMPKIYKQFTVTKYSLNYFET